MKKEKVCPFCKKVYYSPSALSRKDNKTKICPECGTKEALKDFVNFMNNK